MLHLLRGYGIPSNSVYVIMVNAGIRRQCASLAARKTSRIGIDMF